MKNPLSVIKGLAILLEKHCSHTMDGQALEFLTRIQSSSSHMEQLLDELLSLCSTERGEIRIQQVNLSALAHEIMVQFQQQNPERQVEYTITPNLSFAGDLNLLWVVLENLLGNAWKYTQKQPQAKIEFGIVSKNSVSPAILNQLCAREECSDTQILLEENQTIYFVKDNGAGFKMEDHDKLFTPFQRLHSKSEFHGTGIGLATVQRIIHRHKGKICADAVVGQGAVFYFTLSNQPIPSPQTTGDLQNNRNHLKQSVSQTYS